MIAKISLVLNILLIGAVAYLFTQIKGGEKEVSQPETESVQVQEPVDESKLIALNDSTSILRSPVMAFVYGDSISTSYQWQQDRQDELIKAQRRSENKLKKKAEALDKQYKDAEAFASSGQMTENDYAAIQQEFAQGQMEYEQLQMQESEKVAKLQMDMQMDFYKRIEKSLARYADENGLDVILNYQMGGNVLHADGIDVTADVLKILNQEYSDEVAAKKKEK